MRLPGFSAELALGPPTQSYRGRYVRPGSVAQRAIIHPDQLAGPVGDVEQAEADVDVEPVEVDLESEQIEADVEADVTVEPLGVD